MTQGLHRRQFVRVEVSIPVEYTLEGETQPREGWIYDLGGGGMRLVASYDMPPRSLVGLRFRLPATEGTISARGRVVLTFFSKSERKFHHGIAFTAITPKEKAAIAAFVEGFQKR